VKRGGRAWRGPFVMSHGACGRARVTGSSRRQHCHPSTRSVTVRPIRIGACWGWCAPHAHRQQLKTPGLDTQPLRLKTSTGLGGCFGTSHPRGRVPSAPRPGSVGRGHGWWRLRDGRGHPDHSFLLCMWIARGRPARALRFAPASTNTASTAGPRTLRICACDRASCPRAG
jgi:hypothetical protein